MRINVLVNAERSDAVLAAREAVQWLRAKGITVGANREVAADVGADAIRADELANSELVVSFGGDGTLIRAAHICSALGTPILGVHFGRFGFVTQCTPNELGAALSDFFDGKARVTERLMLQARLIRRGQCAGEFHALNEVAVLRSAISNMIVVELSVDGYRLTAYPADGVLVATPTGSTAYNLSAGGPILDPRVRALAISAIAPHTLSARPFIVDASATVRMRVEMGGEAFLSVDGQSHIEMMTADELEITVSPRVTRLICVEPNDFLIKLSERLLWSQPAMREDP